MPCVAAVAAVYRELGLKWTIFSTVYLSALAWLISTFFYQLFRFGEHAGSSIGWLVLVALIFVGFIAALKKKGDLLLSRK